MKGEYNIMKIQTAQGVIFIEAEYQSAERAEMDGYEYVFTDEGCGPIYGHKTADGTFSSYALVSGYR